MAYGFALLGKLTQDSQIEFGAQRSCRQQIFGLAHQISPIVLGGGGELVNVLRQTARGALWGTDGHAISVPSQLGRGIAAAASTGDLNFLAAMQGLTLAVALKERSAGRICGFDKGILD